MIRLGDSSFWLDATALGWVLFEVAGKSRKRSTRRFGPFTSVERVLQQRVVKLPKGVREELAELDKVAGAGGWAHGEVPDW